MTATRKPYRYLVAIGAAAVFGAGLTGTAVAAPERPPETSATTSATVPAPAEAEVAQNCPSGWLCLYEHIDFGGRRLQFNGAGCQNLGPYGFNDKTSSYHNRTRWTFYLWEHAGCRGQRIVVRPGQRASQMGGWNDRVSSISR